MCDNIDEKIINDRLLLTESECPLESAVCWCACWHVLTATVNYLGPEQANNTLEMQWQKCSQAFIPFKWLLFNLFTYFIANEEKMNVNGNCYDDRNQKSRYFSLFIAEIERERSEKHTRNEINAIFVRFALHVANICTDNSPSSNCISKERERKSHPKDMEWLSVISVLLFFLSIALKTEVAVRDDVFFCPFAVYMFVVCLHDVRRKECHCEVRSKRNKAKGKKFFKYVVRWEGIYWKLKWLLLWYNFERFVLQQHRWRGKNWWRNQIEKKLLIRRKYRRKVFGIVDVNLKNDSYWNLIFSGARSRLGSSSLTAVRYNCFMRNRFSSCSISDMKTTSKQARGVNFSAPIRFFACVPFIFAHERLYATLTRSWLLMISGIKQLYLIFSYLFSFAYS